MRQFSSQLDRIESTDKPQITKLNRVRLMQQNRRLLAQVQKLDQVISKVIQKTVANEFEFIEQNQQLKHKYQKEQAQQLKIINRLKKQLKIVRNNHDNNKVQAVKQEQNELICLKKQYERIAMQRDTLIKKKAQKEAALEYHKPLNNQVANTAQKYRKIKSENNQLKMKIHQIEKEINKCHKIKQLAKSSVPKDNDNPSYQFAKIEKQITDMKKQMKRIDQKWRGKIQALDHQYFGFKKIVESKTHDIEMLEKQSKIWEYKSMHYRDQNAVVNDRQRVGSIVISPQKRRQMQDLLAEAKRRGKKVEPQTMHNKSMTGKKGPPKAKSTTNQLPQIESLQPVQPPPQYPKQHQGQKHLQEELIKEQAMVEREPQAKEPKKPTKIMESVGVGTSFYYADD